MQSEHALVLDRQQLDVHVDGRVGRQLPRLAAAKAELRRDDQAAHAADAFGHKKRLAVGGGFWGGVGWSEGLPLRCASRATVSSDQRSISPLPP